MLRLLVPSHHLPDVLVFHHFEIVVVVVPKIHASSPPQNLLNSRFRGYFQEEGLFDIHTKKPSSSFFICDFPNTDLHPLAHRPALFLAVAAKKAAPGLAGGGAEGVENPLIKLFNFRQNF